MRIGRWEIRQKQPCRYERRSGISSPSRWVRGAGYGWFNRVAREYSTIVGARSSSRKRQSIMFLLPFTQPRRDEQYGSQVYRQSQRALLSTRSQLPLYSEDCMCCSLGFNSGNNLVTFCLSTTNSRAWGWTRLRASHERAGPDCGHPSCLTGSRSFWHERTFTAAVVQNYVWLTGWLVGGNFMVAS